MTANGVHIPRVLSADETSEVEKLVACGRYEEAAERFGVVVTNAQEPRDMPPMTDFETHPVGTADLLKMNSIFGIGGLFHAGLTTMVIDHTPDLIVGPNPPKGKGKFQYRLDDKRAETPVKSKPLKRLLKQKGRK